MREAGELTLHPENWRAFLSAFSSLSETWICCR